MTMQIGESSMETAEVKEEQKVYVWLPRDFDKGKHILSWTLSHFPKDKTKIVATFIISPLSTNYSDALLNQWIERSNETLDEHVAQCAIQKFKAEKLIHKNDDVVEGILELIDLMAIKNLVMGFPPNSKVVELVGQKANPSCKIWFIRTGNLLLTRHNNNSFELHSSRTTSKAEVHLSRLDLAEVTSEEIEMELQRREKLHLNKVEMELQRIYMEGIEEIQKTENDEKDLLKRKIEQLELAVLRNQRINKELDKKKQELVKDISDLVVTYNMLKQKHNAIKGVLQLFKRGREWERGGDGSWDRR